MPAGFQRGFDGRGVAVVDGGLEPHPSPQRRSGQSVAILIAPMRRRGRVVVFVADLLPLDPLRADRAGDAAEARLQLVQALLDRASRGPSPFGGPLPQVWRALGVGFRSPSERLLPQVDLECVAVLTGPVVHRTFERFALGADRFVCVSQRRCGSFKVRLGGLGPLLVRPSLRGRRIQCLAGLGDLADVLAAFRTGCRRAAPQPFGVLGETPFDAAALRQARRFAGPQFHRGSWWFSVLSASSPTSVLAFSSSSAWARAVCSENVRLFLGLGRSCAGPPIPGGTGRRRSSS